MSKSLAGRPPKIKTPDEMWGYFEEYKKWCKDNPLFENTVNTKTGEIYRIPRERPYTWESFNNWVNSKNIISDFDDYKKGETEHYKKFSGIITRINREIYSDKYDGAAVGLYNASIIARDLGLADAKKTETTAKIQVVEMTKEERKERLKILKSKL